MSVLVTGGFGAMGSFAVRELVARGERPIILDNRDDPRLVRDIRDRVELVLADIVDWPTLVEVMRKHAVRRVIHTAALMPPVAAANPMLAVDVNIRGLANVAEACRLLEVERLVFASTKGVYASVTGRHAHPHYQPINEDYPKACNSLYDATRLFCERYGLQVMENHGLDFVALRFAHYYGPGKLTHGRMAIVARIVDNAILGRETVIPHGGDQLQDIMYAADCGRALVLACHAKSLDHRQFHVGSGRPCSLHEVAEAVRRAIPEAHIRIGPGLNYMDHGHGHDFYSVFDLSRAREELGYEQQYDIEAGVRHYVDLVRRVDYFGQGETAG